MNHMILSNGDYAIGKYVPTDAVLVPPKPNGPYSWNGSQWEFDGYTAFDALNRLRFERNQLLQETDWMANSDVTMTEQWRTYRQALRDITTQTPSLDSDGNLTGITWPTPPND